MSILKKYAFSRCAWSAATCPPGLVMVEVRWELDAAEMSDDTAPIADASFGWNEDVFTALVVLMFVVLDHGS